MNTLRWVAGVTASFGFGTAGIAMLSIALRRPEDATAEESPEAAASAEDIPSTPLTVDSVMPVAPDYSEGAEAEESPVLLPVLRPVMNGNGADHHGPAGGNGGGLPMNGHEHLPRPSDGVDLRLAASDLTATGPSDAVRTNGTARTITVQPFAVDRCLAAKAAFTTRRVPVSCMSTLVAGKVRPRTGDLLLARVDRLGQHSRIELTAGRRANLHVGDEIIVAYADRYAPDQFESRVPTTLGPTQLVASGGVASEVLSRSTEVSRATDITPVGLVGDDRGSPLNMADFALQPPYVATERPPVLCVLGTSMNSGKTTTIRFLVNGLSRAGYTPGATKVTGTGSGGDYWVMIDAGAHRMLDFTDVGLASTYRIPLEVIEQKLQQLVDHLTVAGCDVILVEVADGLYQQETARLIESDVFRSCVDRVIFAAGDAMGAMAGVAHLRSVGLPPVGVSGRLTRSPLATREAMSTCGVPVYSVAELRDPSIAPAILGLGLPHRPGYPLPGAAQEDAAVLLEVLTEEHS